MNHDFFAGYSAHAPEGISVSRIWRENRLYARATNTTDHVLCVDEIVLLSGELQSADISFYGEGYSMLSQYGGTLGKPASIGGYTDHAHYRLPEAEGWFTVYNLLLIGPSPLDKGWTCLAMTSCNRFVGGFHFNKKHLEAFVRLEDIALAPGESVDLEELSVYEGPYHEDLLDLLAQRLCVNHPPIFSDAARPTGWCSWYCFGPNITAAQIADNLAAIGEKELPLDFLQIDDGYQSAMGDWLTQRDGFAFPGGMSRLCACISDAGLSPAVWVAPFIAEKGSRLLLEHSEWFVHNETGDVLFSDQVSFGGWRCAPWAMLDATHPDAQAFLTNLFAEMQKAYSCRYFKLDANMWGALPFGVRHNANATSVEAYRLGMRAILDGLSKDTYVLGCNAPMWPSLGLVHGMRVTGDIKRKFPTIARCRVECLGRSWQNRALWWNDPDCAVLDNIGGTYLSEDEFRYHAAVILASGGAVLSSDNLTHLSEAARDTLVKILGARPDAARYNPEYNTWTTRFGRGLLAFYWNDGSEIMEKRVRAKTARSFFDDDAMETVDGTVVFGVPPHGVRVLYLDET